MNSSIKNLKILKWFGLASFFSLIFLIFYFHINSYIYVDIYSHRDISRAIGWLRGVFFWPGPEMSTGSNLPGPFFYFLLFPPLVFGENIYSQSLIWLITWLSLAYTAAFWFINQICKHKESSLIFIMFFISSVGDSLFYSTWFGWNAAFAVMFHILSVIILYYWTDTGKNLYLYFLGLTIGFGMQIHFLVSMHFLTALLFYLCGKDKSIKSFLLFVILILLPCLPYLLMHGLNILETSTYSTLYLDYLLESILSEVWMIFTNSMTSFKIYVMGPVLFSFFLIIRKKIAFTKSTIQLLIIMSVPMFMFFLTGTRAYYLYSMPVFLMLLFSKFCDDLLPNNIDKRLNYLLIYGILFIAPLLRYISDPEFYQHIIELTKNYLIMLLCLAVIFLLTVKNFSYNSLIKICVLLFVSHVLFYKDFKSHTSPFPPQTFYIEWANYHDIKSVFKQIISETNWSVEKARKRIYTIGIASEADLSFYYSLTREKTFLTKSEGNLKVSDDFLKADGYFIVQHLKQFTSYNKKDWRIYLSRSPFVEDFIRKEIKTNKLIIKTTQLHNKKFWLISYKITKDSVFPEAFYNGDQPYYWEEPDWLKNCKSSQYFEQNKEFYYCLILPEYLQRAGVHIKFFSEVNKQFMEIDFFGPLIGTKISTILHGWAFWSNIQISLSCNGKQYVHSVPSIGNRWYPQQNWSPKSKLPTTIKFLSSPLKIKLPIYCQEKEISEIKLNFHQEYWNQEYWKQTYLSKDEKKEIVWKIL